MRCIWARNLFFAVFFWYIICKVGIILDPPAVFGRPTSHKLINFLTCRRVRRHKLHKIQPPPPLPYLALHNLHMNYNLSYYEHMK